MLITHTVLQIVWNVIMENYIENGLFLHIVLPFSTL